MEVKKVKDVANLHGIKAILHGPSGSGKTFTISTIPDPESVIVLSAESGLLSIKDAAGNVDVVIIKSTDDLRDAYNELYGDKKYKTIVLDSLTEIAQQILSEELESSKDGRKAYGELNERAIKLIKSFRDLPGKNVILICQSGKVQDEQNRIFTGISMPGKKVGHDSPYLVDLVGFMVSKVDDDKKRYGIQFHRDDFVEAKDRSGKLNSVEPADWTHIFNKINGDK